MDVRDAIRTAKSYFNDLFAEEKITEVGLEEVIFDDAQERWMITLGFARASYPMNRWYKVITLEDNGKFVSVRNRETADA